MDSRREAGRSAENAGRAVVLFLAAPAQASDGVTILGLSGMGMRDPGHGMVLAVISIFILVSDVLFEVPDFLTGMCSTVAVWRFDDEPWLLVSDGGLRGHRGGVGLVLARHGTIVAVRGYSLLVHAGSSTVMEWIAKALLLLVTAHLKGKRVLVADSAAGAFTGASLPHYHTWVDAMAKQALKSINLEEYSEGWIQARHDSGMKEFLAQCNERADSAATEQLLAAQVSPFPIQEQWASGPILQVEGRYVVDLDASLDKLYDDAMIHRASLGLHGWCAGWSSYDHVRAMKGGEASRESHRMLMLLRVLGTQLEREGYGQECPWCGRCDALRASHLANACPGFYLRWVSMQQKFVAALDKVLDWELDGMSDLEALFRRGEQRLWVSVQPDGGLQDYQRVKAGDEIILCSWSGRYFTSGPLRNSWGGCPVPMAEIFQAWDSSKTVDLETVQGLFSTGPRT